MSVKADKRRFYCTICLVDLSSLETMKSHISGAKHTKRQSERITKEEDQTSPIIMEIPNPVSTRVKVPVRLQEKIVACPEPVVGLDFVTELIAVSDPEMEPHYNCELCGRQGIANGMLSHLLGHKHRQNFMEHIYRDDLARVLDLTQAELLKYAKRYAENDSELSRRIRTRRSDEDFPWPAGKAPWSVERGGTGIPPDSARENWGRGNPRIAGGPSGAGGGAGAGAGVGDGGGRNLEFPSWLSPAANRQEALRMVDLAERMLQYGLAYLKPQDQDTARVDRLIRMTTGAVMNKLLEEGQEVPSQRG